MVLIPGRRERSPSPWRTSGRDRPRTPVLTLGRAANRYPDYSKSYVALGRLWFERARTNGDRVDLSKALGALEAAIANDDSSEALSLYGRALLLAREDGHAEQVLVRATTVLPVDSLAFFALAEAAGRLGHAAVARRALLDYHALEGDDPDEHAAVELAIRIADLSMKIGDNVSAVAWYEHAIGSSDGDIPTLIRLAQAQLLAGLQDAARVTLTRVLEKDPANRTAQSASEAARMSPISRVSAPSSDRARRAARRRGS